MNQPLLRYALLAIIAGVYRPADSASPSADEAKQWLERMIQSTQTLNYEGTFIYIQGPHVEAMRLVHSGDKGERKKRLMSLTGPLREIVATSEGVVCLLPKQYTTFTSSGLRQARFPISIPSELSRLEGQYDFEVVGQDRTAGVDTQVVAIMPRDGWRYGYRLWLDRRNGMLLRSVLLDEHGLPIEQLMFTDLQIKQHIDEAAFKTSVAKEREGLTSAAQFVAGAASSPASAPLAQSVWKVARVPPGFEKTSHYGVAGASGQPLNEHLVFADGLATVSVFVERLGREGTLLEGRSQLGAMNAFGIRLEDYQIVVVGEVPADTVQAIAASVSREPEPIPQSSEERKP
ncbi:MAG: MucB/RseB C-terminal domain-containing protein [Candidatus Competibacteraceae bacterium]|nr:MucB/RseB C-terminal domain-containing protein [Candidatus Competibacteraceae bacterium]